MEVTSVDQGNTLLSWGINPSTADMHYMHQVRGVATEYELGLTPYNKASMYVGSCNIDSVLPAWSFSKLFEMLPCLETHCRVDHPMLHKLAHGDYCAYWINYKYKRIHTDFCKSPVEAAISMIKLLINRGYHV